MTLRNFVTPLHTRTKRDYVARVVEHDKAECATVAKRFGAEYWDGNRKYGYGGYRYDGRWEVVARAMIDHYQLAPDANILDVGCGKAFLMYEFQKLLPDATVKGIDISQYAVENGKPEMRDHVQVANATELPFKDNSFDLVISLGTLHNLKIYDLMKALEEMERIKRHHAYMMTESYRNESEKVNLMYWQLTCESFYSPEEWVWLFEHTGFTGDHEFIYFE